MTGISPLPNINFYWSDSLFGNEVIKNTMSRDRFKTVKKNIHLCDNNNIDAADKFAKITPLNNLLNKKFMQFGIFSHELSIDEQMIAYFGRHSCKMFIKGKPIRFGFKYWCLCSSEGYLYQFIPYSGASGNTYDKTYGLGENVVTKLLEKVDKPIQHTVTFDNFFTSHRLIARLSSLGYFATGNLIHNWFILFYK